MPKKVFWPLVLVIAGLIFMAANLDLLPKQFWHLWPLLFIIVGLGGLLTYDRDEWLWVPRRSHTTKPKSKVKPGRSRRR